MSLTQLATGLAVALGVGVVGALGGAVYETVVALLNSERRALIKERGFWESARHMLS